jgi:hypothetical protein
MDFEKYAAETAPTTQRCDVVHQTTTFRGLAPTTNVQYSQSLITFFMGPLPLRRRRQGPFVNRTHGKNGNLLMS